MCKQPWVGWLHAFLPEVLGERSDNFANCAKLRIGDNYGNFLLRRFVCFSTNLLGNGSVLLSRQALKEAQRKKPPVRQG